MRRYEIMGTWPQFASVFVGREETILAECCFFSGHFEDGQVFYPFKSGIYEG